jgi:hypothetical protein
MLVTGTNVQTIRKSLKNKVDTLPDDLVIAIWTLLDNPGMHEQLWQDPLKEPANANEYGVAKKGLLINGFSNIKVHYIVKLTAKKS